MESSTTAVCDDSNRQFCEVTNIAFDLNKHKITTSQELYTFLKSLALVESTCKHTCVNDPRVTVMKQSFEQHYQPLLNSMLETVKIIHRSIDVEVTPFICFYTERYDEGTYLYMIRSTTPLSKGFSIVQWEKKPYMTNAKQRLQEMTLTHYISDAAGQSMHIEIGYMLPNLTFSRMITRQGSVFKPEQLDNDHDPKTIAKYNMSYTEFRTLDLQVDNMIKEQLDMTLRLPSMGQSAGNPSKVKVAGRIRKIIYVPYVKVQGKLKPLAQLEKEEKTKAKAKKSKAKK
jgi:hypothetical protein